MEKFNHKSAYILFGGVLGGWVACLTVIAQQLTNL
jgi:hypothetical protein